MKIFISWSGERSRIIAEGLNEWLPNIFQYIETFYSPNIEKGTKGGAEINATLEGTSFGIICLTPDNLQNKWIHYEAGALAKINDDNTRVWTLLIGLNPSNVEQPLAQFQHTLANKQDIYKLLESINQHLEKPLLETALHKTFERWWSDFEEKIKEAENVTDGSQITENNRNDREILDEILDILRTQQRFAPTDFEYAIQSLNKEIHTVGDEFLTSVYLPVIGGQKATEKELSYIESGIKTYLHNPQFKKVQSGNKLGYQLMFIEPISKQRLFQGVKKINLVSPYQINFRLSGVHTNIEGC